MAKEQPIINSNPNQNVNSPLFHSDEFPLQLSQNNRGRILRSKALLPIYDKINLSKHQIMNEKYTYKLTNQGRVFLSWSTQN